jgi:phosphoglycolate phosphatase
MHRDRQFDIILFDHEGTLVDFQWRLEDAVKELLPILSKAGIDPALYGASPSYAVLFNTTRDITRAWDPQKAGHLFRQMAAIYDSYDRDALKRWTPYPDALPVLGKLSAAGYRLGVVSNIGSHAVDTLLERYNLTHYFEIILSRNDVSHLKPSPEGLKLALDKLCASAERTLFVGDSLNDILAAAKVPMSSCFLLGGESRVTREKGDSATFQISSLADLPKLLT